MPRQSRHFLLALFNLQQVAKLFNDTITIIRDDRPDVEPQAIAWLKSARYTLMRDLEKKYYELDRSRAQPLLRPDWALDPSKKLLLWTENLPAVLDAYEEAIRENLRTLLRDCGFHHCRITSSSCGAKQLYIEIGFPAQLTAGSPSGPSSSPLHVEDAFSRFGVDGEGRASAFSGTSFARLLLETRQNAANGSATATSPATADGNAPTSEVRASSPAPEPPQRSQSGPPPNAAEGSKSLSSKKQKKNKRRQESRKSKGGIPSEDLSAPAATTPAARVLPDAQTTAVQHKTSTATEEAQPSEGLEEKSDQDVDDEEQEKYNGAKESGVNEGLQMDDDEGQGVEFGHAERSIGAEAGRQTSSATSITPPSGPAVFATTNIAVRGSIVVLIGAWWAMFLEIRVVYELLTLEQKTRILIQTHHEDNAVADDLRAL
ncbi:hypothetical protein B0H16DRAFT_1466201 [Mycena metata]|uniref:Uncharacterized protein n=1 Tax=Mycena metata TaxID=1033252 RepID=A0AAD7IAE7_9AGAR|nr:hypothetical protein B0H16DRAFT_1466201 [Mycena metata]